MTLPLASQISRASRDAFICVALIEEGLLLKEIEARFGLAEGTASRILKRCGVDWRHGTKTPDDWHRRRVDDYNAAVMRGMPRAAAALEAGVSYPQQVWLSARKFGLALASPADFRRADRRARVRRLAAGSSRRGIAQMLGITQAAVRAALAPAA